MKVFIGKKASRSITLTPEHVRKYSEITGDLNPLHHDQEFTAKTRFGRLVVQGGLTYRFITRAGCYGYARPWYGVFKSELEI
jgi:acyl dehydratase